MPKAPEEDAWHLFNDFLVRPVQTNEALTFNTAWKLPSVIAYQIKAANNRIDETWKRNLDLSLLYTDTKYILEILHESHLTFFTALTTVQGHTQV